MTITNASPEIDRDRYGRPMVLPPGGGKKVAYTRCTTFVGVLEDMFNLQQWEKRMVALGLAQRPDLMLAVSAHKDDKTKLNRICDEAKEASAASAAATTGTALHALTEIVDRGQDLPPLPLDAAASLAAYQQATVDLSAVHIERFCVQDTYRIGGTPDRVVAYQGKRYIADVKSGNIEFGTLKIAMQLAVYSRSKLYDLHTGARTDHGAEFDRGIVIHLPAGDVPAEQRTCSLYWIDLLAGWEAVKTASTVREKRKIKFGDLTTPFNGHGVEVTEQLAASIHDEIAQQIFACTNPDAVRGLWALHEDAWSDDLTKLAVDHIAGLAS